MSKFIKIDGIDIEGVLSSVTRQYLVGNLKRPQELKFIKDDNLEIGITDYSEYTIEPPHYHTSAIEYQLMISGRTKYYDLTNKIEHEFVKGDFYCIEKNTTYAQKAEAGTRILFIKVPSINDKNVIEITKEVQQWYEKGMD